VGNHGHPVAPGEIGEVVVTHLDALAMPLIRYRIGDLARAAHPLHIEKLTYPEKLTEVRGRITDQIICRQGNDYKRMHALSLIYVLREADGLRQFRIIQHAVDELLVEVVTDEAFTPQIAEAVLVGLRQRMGPQAQIEIRRRERLDNNAAGKHACVVSRLNS
jgi:phenylacetate-CoA ligase